MCDNCDNHKSDDFKKTLGGLSFGTAFKATCAFYLAQTLMTLLGLGAIGLVILIAIFLIK
jgi:hypothetical protein